MQSISEPEAFWKQRSCSTNCLLDNVYIGYSAYNAYIGYTGARMAVQFAATLTTLTFCRRSSVL
jgi:hypothetical protein